MNYQKWGEEYLEEAERIKEKIHSIKTSAPPQTHEERLQKMRRTSILYDMYLECRHTGRLLKNRHEKNSSIGRKHPLQ